MISTINNPNLSFERAAVVYWIKYYTRLDTIITEHEHTESTLNNTEEALGPRTTKTSETKGWTRHEAIQKTQIMQSTILTSF